MGDILGGEYRVTPRTHTTTGQYGNSQLDKNGNLLVKSRPQFREDNQFVAGAASTTGKIDAVAASAPAVIIGVDCSDFPVEAIDWAIAFDNSWSYQYARSNGNALSATITFTDATAVDADDTFVLNGVTWTAKTSGAVAASHEYNLGADNAAASVALAAALSGAYGPGVTATSAPVAATDVITITATTATVLQFAQGTSASNEIAWVETSKLGLDFQGAQVTGKTTTAAWHAETLPSHYIDGWGWGYIIITNDEASTAILEARATRR